MYQLYTVSAEDRRTGKILPAFYEVMAHSEAEALDRINSNDERYCWSFPTISAKVAGDERTKWEYCKPDYMDKVIQSGEEDGDFQEGYGHNFFTLDSDGYWVSCYNLDGNAYTYDARTMIDCLFFCMDMNDCAVPFEQMVADHSIDEEEADRLLWYYLEALQSMMPYNKDLEQITPVHYNGHTIAIYPRQMYGITVDSTIYHLTPAFTYQYKGITYDPISWVMKLIKEGK